MSESRDERVQLAENENLFREINEHLEASVLVGSDGASAQRCSILCECADVGCTEMIDLSAGDYERVRSVATRFVIRPGHDEPGVERVLERHPTHWVVEKTGVAGEVAEELDPRDSG